MHRRSLMRSAEQPTTSMSGSSANGQDARPDQHLFRASWSLQGGAEETLSDLQAEEPEGDIPMVVAIPDLGAGRENTLKERSHVDPSCVDAARIPCRASDPATHTHTHTRHTLTPRGVLYVCVAGTRLVATPCPGSGLQAMKVTMTRCS